MNDMSPALPPAPETPERLPPPSLGHLRNLLLEQALSLDGMFNGFTIYAVEIVPDGPERSLAYLRIALRAQASCRASVESIARSDRFMREAAESGENEKSCDQPHAPGK